jgi:hypothetical protein
LTAMQNYIFYTGKVVTRFGIKGDMDSLREAAKSSSPPGLSLGKGEE